MRTKLLAAAALTLLVPVLATGPALASHSWGSYHWARTSNPFTLKLGDNVSTAWDSYLGVASSDWSASSVLDTTVVAGGTKPKPCRATTGRVEVCSSAYGFTGWLGIAGIYVSGSHITAGYVKVNDSYFNTSSYNTPGWRQMVMCQEVGHTFGLGHQDETFDNANLGTCMDYTSSPEGGVVDGFDFGPANLSPNAHDYEQLETIYAHLDSTTTVGAATTSGSARGGLPAAGTDQSSWGRRVEGSRAEGHSVHVLELGHDRRVITFVTWVR